MGWWSVGGGVNLGAVEVESWGSAAKSMHACGDGMHSSNRRKKRTGPGSMRRTTVNVSGCPGCSGGRNPAV